MPQVAEGAVGALAHRMHPVVTPEQIVTDRDYIMERAGNHKEQDDEGQPADNEPVVFLESCGHGCHDHDLLW
jgi:hypothetical protein